jgi:hypothetical protein
MRKSEDKKILKLWSFQIEKFLSPHGMKLFHHILYTPKHGDPQQEVKVILATVAVAVIILSQ